MHRTVAVALTLLVTPALAHDPVDASASLPIDGGYKDGLWLGTSDGLWKLKLNGLVQGRLEGETTDMTVDHSSSTFQVRRAQVKLSGHALTPAATFAVEGEFGQGFPYLKDGWVDYALIPGVVQVRVGQWKKAFSRLELTSDAKQAFLERSTMNGFFGAGRDVGVAIHDDVTKSPMFEYAVGVFAGTTDKPQVVGQTTIDPALAKGPFPLENGKLTNVSKLMTPTFVGRVGYNFGDVKGYDEMDMDGGAPRFGVGAAAMEAIDPGLGDARGMTRAEIDGVLKLYGFDASAAVFTGFDQSGASTFEQEYLASGVHAQVGWLIGGLSHPALRVDYLSGASSADDQIEIGAAHTLLVLGRNVQWQVDASSIWKESTTGFAPSWRARTQLALAF